MRKHLVLSAALMLLSGVAFAQSTTPAATDPTPTATPATTTDPNTPGNAHMVAASALEKGANSFTEGQARSRLERAGLSNLSDLKKDDLGIWRGKAMRSGKSVSVGLDYKGNIAAE